MMKTRLYFSKTPKQTPDLQYHHQSNEIIEENTSVSSGRHMIKPNNERIERKR
jgi:hypothetical protein